MLGNIIIYLVVMVKDVTVQYVRCWVRGEDQPQAKEYIVHE